MRFTLSRGERLRSSKIIKALFQDGTSGFLYPFRYSFVLLPAGESGYPVQVLFAVPKRRIRKAVFRNLIRRRSKEAFRLHKHILAEPLKKGAKTVAILFTYIANEPEAWAVIEKKIVLLLREIETRVAGMPHGE